MGKNSGSVNDRLLGLLFEYLKDASRSDREIAKSLGVTQATVSRMKQKLLDEGFVTQFSAIPNLPKMGYNIMAFSFVKFNLDQVMDIEGKAIDWAKSHPEILFTSRAEGMGMDAITVTVHKDYAAYKEFLLKNKKMWGNTMTDVHYILVDLNGEITKPLSFKYLVENQEE